MQDTLLHLGLGAFHRAHQAAIIQRMHDAGDCRWRIASGNIRPDPDDAAPAIVRQGGQYTLETVAPSGLRSYALISAIAQALPYQPGIPGVIAIGASERTRVISFTVTEAGYFLDANDLLDSVQPDLANDLAALRRGCAGATIYGALAAILMARIDSGAGPVTLLCCDNLRHNGTRFRSGMQQFLALLGNAALAQWFDAHTSCPNAMVDRITPRATPALRERVRQATGRLDHAAVMSERFIQWVMEDDFVAGRPAWESAGVQMVASVAPYEEAKIRILNASHSCLAWAGALAGHTLIHQAMRDVRIDALVRAYVTGAVFDCLRPSPIDLEAYLELVIERFASDAIEDTIERVAADGLAKLAGFIVPTMRERLARGLDIGAVANLAALYLLFLQGWHRGELGVPYQDQGLDLAAVKALCEASDPVAAFCALPAVWAELAGHPGLQASIRAATLRLQALSYRTGS